MGYGSHGLGSSLERTARRLAARAADGHVVVVGDLRRAGSAACAASQRVGKGITSPRVAMRGVTP